MADTKEQKKKKGKGRRVEKKDPAFQTGTIEKATEIPRLKKRYDEAVVPEYIKDFKKSNRFEVPRLEKIVVNMGVSEAKENIQSLDTARDELSVLTGQRPQIRRIGDSNQLGAQIQQALHGTFAVS